ncbi:MAG: hypothetical protein COB46_03715, partial [Rhodospirillaceae bacterium]
MAIFNDPLSGTVATGESTTLAVDASTGDTLTMPEGLNPAMADYSHEGPDLVMTWPDGSEVTVTDYFTVDPQPDLVSTEGAKVGGDLASRLSGSDTPGMVADLGTGVSEQSIGQVEKIEGTVTAIRADGTKVELQVGDPVYQGDILETSADGAIGVILADETTFSMAEEGRMVLDEMVYDPGTQEGSVSLSVMHGVFTFVSGNVAKTDPDAMTLTTPVATIGIRGTQLGIDLSDGQTLKAALMEEADGFIGEVVIMNDAGVSVLNGANEYSVISSFSVAPTETIVLSMADMINTFASALRHLPLSNQNVNDYGLQGHTVQEGLNAQGLADFDTAAGGDPDATGFNDLETAAGGSDNSEDGIAAAGLADFDVAGTTPIADAATILDVVDAKAGSALDLIITQQAPPGEPLPVDDPTKDTGGSGGERTPDPDPEITATISVDPAQEDDASFALNIDVTTAYAAVGSIIISGVPSEVTLSAGTDNGNGTWTLTEAQLNGLTIKPDADYAGTFNLSVSASTTAGLAATAVSATATVTPVADTPTLDLNAAVAGDQASATLTADANSDIALNITTVETDVDGSEVLSITIANVPTDATLSAGTKNADGTWTLTEGQLSGLTLTPATDYNGTLNLTVTSTSTDTLGNVSDSASTSGTITVTVAPPPVVLDPAISATISVAPAQEDGGAFALNVDVAVTDATVGTITISGVPTEVTLSAGTNNGDGTWSLTTTQLSGLTITPDADYAGTFDLSVAASTAAGLAATPASATATVTPVADAPTLSASAASGNEDAAIALNISTAETDVDGSEVLSMTISGVPADAILSAGTKNTDGTWTLDPTTDLAGLTITPAANYSGSFNLTVVSTSTDTLGAVSDSASTTTSLSVTVAPVGDTPGVAVVGNGSGVEDGTVPIGVTVTPVAGEAVASIVVTGIPTGATLSLGTQNTDGSWTISGADLANLSSLSMTPVADYAGTPTLGFAVTTDQGGTASVSLGVTVTPVADAPTLDLNAAVAGDQASATITSTVNSDVALNITTAETDVDGSEVLSITIGNLPTGATLSAGAQNTDGTWTLTEAQLSGLTLTPATDYSGTINLSVTSTSTDTLGNVTDSASTTGTITIEIPTPTVTVTSVSATGQEDGTFALDISISTTDTTVDTVVISGVQAGATLSAGTDNGNGTWTLAAADLAGLTISPIGNFSGTFDLTVTATTTTTGVSDSGAGTVSVTPVADAPTLIGSAAGTEDAAFALNITAAVTDLDGSEAITNLTITGMPAGATLSAGTQNANGSWTLTTAELASLTVTPPADYAGTFSINMTAQVKDTAGNLVDFGTTSTAFSVTVNPVADMPTLDLNAAVAGNQAAATLTATEDSAIALNITTAETDTDGSEVLSITIAGVPTGAVLSAGTQNTDGTWTLTEAQLTGLTITPAANYNGNFDLTVTTTSTDTLGNVSDSASTSGTIGITVTPVADVPTVSIDPVTVPEDSVDVPLTITVAGTGGIPVTSVTISGLPAGAVLSAGTQNTDGTWTLTPDQLTGLTFTPVGDYSGTFDLSVTATSGDGSTSPSVSAGMSVTPVADAPVVTGSATGAEDSTFALDITAAVTDTDGSEAITSYTITGVPAGADLSAGTQNTDGSWTLTPAQLAGLTITPPADYSGTFTLNVTAQVLDTAGNLTSTTSGAAFVDVTVTPVADAPVLVGAATGAEDSAFALNISAAVTDADGSESITALTITGMPAGATLSAGTQNANGSWSLTSAELQGLTITPPADYSGTFSLNLTAQVTDTAGNLVDVGTTSAAFDVTVTPVADAPTLSATAASGNEDTAIPLTIATAETDVDGSEVLSMVISGVPADAVLSAGTKNTDGTWTLDPATDLAGLTITPAANYSGSFTLTVVSTSTDTLGNVTDSASTTTTLDVTIAPVGDVPGIAVVGNGSGVEDGTVPIGVTVTPVAGEAVASIVVTGVPAGATLSLGTKGTDGNWTISGNDLSSIGNLVMTPAADYAGTPTLGFAVTTDQGGTATASLAVTVTPVADAPTLSTTAATGNEDTAIALNISTAETDVDGSEVLSMVISGVPDGAVLSAGTKNTDGTWTLDPATDLAGLTMTPPANFNGTIDLTVVSTSTDTLGNVTDSASTTGTMTVSVAAAPDAPTLAVAPATGPEDSAGIPISITATGTGGVPLTSVTITGVPAGATLSAGTQNTDGSWTLTPAELSGLTLTPVGNYSGTFDLNVTATSGDGSTSSGTVGVSVTPVADAPVLVGSASGAEDSAFALNISAAVTDADGSESITALTITGMPAGATLSAGTQNANG